MVFRVGRRGYTFRMEERGGVPALLGGAVLISFSAVFVKLAGVHPTVSGFYRMAFGGLTLVLIARLRGERLWSGWRAFRFQVLAALLFTGDLTVWHRSILQVGPGLATLLANFQVFVLTGFDLALGRNRVSPRRLLAVPIALGGLFLIVGVGWETLAPEARLGTVLGLTTAFFYASYILVLPLTHPGEGRSGGGKVRIERSNHFGNMAVISLLTCAFLAIEPLHEGLGFAIPDPESLLALAAYGFFCQALGQLLLYRGRLRTVPSLVGLLILLQPVLSFVWDILFFARPTLPREVLGAAIAIFAIRLGAKR